jgi:ribosomal protein S18 acetylase RimI-like enzyme
MNTQLIGFLVASQKTEHIHIHRFVVDRMLLTEFQISEPLSKTWALAAITKWFETVQPASVTLFVSSHNAAAISLYKRLGFRLSSTTLGTDLLSAIWISKK